MYRTQRHMATLVYLAGVCGFGFHNAIARADWDLLGALGYGAQWPITLLQMI